MRRMFTPGGIDLQAFQSTQRSISRYHAEHARYGGTSREFHERALTSTQDDSYAIVLEFERLLERLADAEQIHEFIADMADGSQWAGVQARNRYREKYGVKP